MQNVMQALYLTRNARGLPASARRYIRQRGRKCRRKFGKRKAGEQFQLGKFVQQFRQLVQCGKQLKGGQLVQQCGGQQQGSGSIQYSPCGQQYSSGCIQYGTRV